MDAHLKLERVEGEGPTAGGAAGGIVSEGQGYGVRADDTGASHIPMTGDTAMQDAPASSFAYDAGFQGGIDVPSASQGSPYGEHIELHSIALATCDTALGRDLLVGGAGQDVLIGGEKADGTAHGGGFMGTVGFTSSDSTSLGPAEIHFIEVAGGGADSGHTGGANLLLADGHMRFDPAEFFVAPEDSAVGQTNVYWGLDRIDQQPGGGPGSPDTQLVWDDTGASSAQREVSAPAIQEMTVSKQSADAGGVIGAGDLGDWRSNFGSSGDAAGSGFDDSDGFVGGVFVAASDAAADGFAFEPNAAEQHRDHKNWINVASCDMGGHKTGSGASTDNTEPGDVVAASELTEFDFSFNTIEIGHGGGPSADDLALFDADAAAPGNTYQGMTTISQGVIVVDHSAMMVSFHYDLA